MMAAPRGMALPRFWPTLRGFLAGTLFGRRALRPRAGPDRWEVMVRLPDAASRTSWAVRGIRAAPSRGDTPN
jgi:hypothetical protein